MKPVRMSFFISSVPFAFLLNVTPVFSFPGSNASTAPISVPRNNTAREIKLLSFNVWASGTNVKNGRNKVLNAILMSGTDIVGLSETSNDFGNALADKLDWHITASGDNNIISRYPIKKTWNSTKGIGAEINVGNGKTIVVQSVHLTAYPYGPYDACLDGAPDDKIFLDEETTSGRVTEIAGALLSIDSYLKDGTPTFLLGDLNSPSHLDWTGATAERHCSYVVEWPVTRRVEQAGMTDSYRRIYPDPASHPGVTWSPIYKTWHYGDGKPEPLDRIDFVFFKGENVLLLDADVFVVGTPAQIPLHLQNEWPSDHAAALADFTVETGGEIGNGPSARFYAGSAAVVAGETVHFTDNSSNNPTQWSWTFEGGTPNQSAEQNPSVAYNTAGDFSVTLIAANSEGRDTTRVKGLILVDQAAAPARLELDKKVYGIGEAIEATFSNGPGNPTDWVGIYRPGQVPGNGSDYSTLWLYVNGSRTASDALENGWVTFDPGLTEAGSWWAGFFANDGYALLDSLSFTVIDPSGIRGDVSAVMPETLSLNNYPNPFNSGTTIVFTLPRKEDVTLKIFDIRGKTLATLVQRKMSRGKHTMRFNGDDLASGVYFYMLQSGREVITNRMLLLK
jgi:PKD repeat protein